MTRVRSSTHMGIALAALALVAPWASASQLNLVPVLQISGQYSDNVFFTETDTQSDTFFLINPGIGIDYASERLVASVSYQVGLQRFTDFDDRDNSVHRINASLGFNLSSGWYIDVSDNLYITDDPLAFDASGDRLQRDSFVFNRLTPSVSYVFGGRDVRVAGRFDRIDVDYDNLVDSEQNGFGVNVSAKLGSLSTIGFDFAHFKRDFVDDRPEFNVIDYTGRRFGVLVDRRLTSRISGQVSVGFEDREFDGHPERDFDAVVFDVGLTGELPELFSWSFGYNRHLNDLAVQGAYAVDRLPFDVRKSLVDRVSLELGGYFQDSENEQLGEKAEYFGFRLEGQYLVTKFLNVWLGYEFVDRDSEQLNPFQENRVNFGLTVSYGL